MKINKIAFAVLTALVASRAAYAVDDTNPPAGTATAPTATTPATPAPTNDANKPNTLQTVTVTAQHTVQDIQDVPITIQAFTGTDLAAVERHVVR